jgi:hypothetical protein
MPGNFSVGTLKEADGFCSHEDVVVRGINGKDVGVSAILYVRVKFRNGPSYKKDLWERRSGDNADYPGRHGCNHFDISELAVRVDA